MRDNFDRSLRRVLSHEGGYTNHPSDPGGPTKYGITIFDYRKYVKPDAGAAEVRAMTLDEAKAIYRARYWAALCCDKLPAGLDYAVFDYGVNSGVGRAAKVLQRLLGVADDGRIGPATIAAVRRRDAAELIVRLCEERLAFLKRLKTWPVFGAGWGRRVAEVRAASLAMAAAPLASSNAIRHASETQPVPGQDAAPVNTAAQKASTGAIAAAGAAAAQQAHQAGASLVIVAAVVAATAALAIGVWFWWRRRRRQQQEA
jgi:lysozyme family protein